MANGLENLMNPQTLSQLATVFQNQTRQLQADSQLKTGNVGGYNLLDNRKEPTIGVPEMQGVNDMIGLVQQQQQQESRTKFVDSVKTIMGSTATKEDKISQLQELKLQHGDDYGLGVDDIVKQYNTAIDQDISREKNKSKKTSKKVTDVDKFIGEMVTGTVKENDEHTQIMNPEQVRKQAMRKFGQDYNSKFPEIEKAINEMFPPDQFGFAVGEVRDFGKGKNYKYLGNNQWALDK